MSGREPLDAGGGGTAPDQEPPREQLARELDQQTRTDVRPTDVIVGRRGDTLTGALDQRAAEREAARTFEGRTGLDRGEDFRVAPQPVPDAQQRANPDAGGPDVTLTGQGRQELTARRVEEQGGFETPDGTFVEAEVTPQPVPDGQSRANPDAGGPEISLTPAGRSGLIVEQVREQGGVETADGEFVDADPLDLEFGERGQLTGVDGRGSESESGGGGPLDSAVGFVADAAPSPDLSLPDVGGAIEQAPGGDFLTYNAASTAADGVASAADFAQRQTRYERAVLDGIGDASVDVATGFRDRVVDPVAGAADEAGDAAFTVASANPTTDLTAALAPGTQTAAAEVESFDDIGEPETVGGDAVESAVRGTADVPAFAIESPEIALNVGRGAYDIASDAGGDLQAGNPGEALATAGGRSGGVAVDAIDRFLTGAASDPVRTGAALVTSAGALGAASRAGPATSAATRAAIQPGVEALTFGARQTIGRTTTGAAALDRIPGDALGPEEIVLGTAARGARAGRSAATRLRDLSAPSTPDLSLDAPPSPRQQAQIDAIRDLEGQARALEADGRPPGGLSPITFRRDVSGLVDTDAFGFPRGEGPGRSAGENQTRLDDRQTATPTSDPPELPEFRVPEDAFPAPEFGSGRSETTARGQRFGDVAAGPNISFESVADQLPDNLRTLLEDEDASASLLGRQRGRDREPSSDTRERQEESQQPFTERGQTPFEEIRSRRDERAGGRTEPLDSRPLQFGFERFVSGRRSDGAGPDQSGTAGDLFSRLRGPDDMLGTGAVEETLNRAETATEPDVERQSDTGLDTQPDARLDSRQGTGLDSRQGTRPLMRPLSRARLRGRQRGRLRTRQRTRTRTRQRTRARARQRTRTRSRRRPPDDPLPDDEFFPAPGFITERAAGAWRTPVARSETVAANLGLFDAPEGGSDRSNPGTSADVSGRAVPDGGRERDLYDEFGFGGSEESDTAGFAGFDALEDDLASGGGFGGGAETGGAFGGFDALENDLASGGGFDDAVGGGMGGFDALEEDLAGGGAFDVDEPAAGGFGGGGLPSADDLASGGAFGGGGLEGGAGGGLGGFDALEDDLASGGAFGGGADTGGSSGLPSSDELAGGGGFGGGGLEDGAGGGMAGFGALEEDLAGGGAFGGGTDDQPGSPLAPPDVEDTALGGLLREDQSQEETGDGGEEEEEESGLAPREREDIGDAAAEAANDARKIKDPEKAKEFLERSAETVEEQRGEKAAEEFKEEVNRRLDDQQDSERDSASLRQRASAAASSAVSRVRSAVSRSSDGGDDSGGEKTDSSRSDPRASSRPGADPRASSRPQFEEDSDEDEDDEEGD